MSQQTPRPRPPHVAVIGDGDPRGPEAHRILEWAEEVGQLLARGGAVVITGGNGSTGCTSNPQACLAIQIISESWDISGNALVDMPYDPDELFTFVQRGLVH